jgi:hypothetical protein
VIFLIYIKLEEQENIDCKNKLLYFFSKIKYKFVKLREEKFENKTLIIIKDTTNQTLNKLSQYIKQKCVNRVCISNNLLNNKIFMEFIKNENVKIFDGKWLFKHLVSNCLEYITRYKKEKCEYQEVSILTNNIDELIVDDIKELASKVRVVNIITDKENKFRKLERELYEERGIILNMNNNYKKSLVKSDIIFNFDFSEEEINKYTLPKKSCIINFNEEIKILTKVFEGINVYFYEIQIPRKYINNLLYLKDFDTSILYESFIYKNTSPKNIKNEINKDDANIVFLIGRNGKIRKTEYLKMSKKIAN